MISLHRAMARLRRSLAHPLYHLMAAACLAYTAPAQAITLDGWTCTGICNTSGAAGAMPASPASAQFGYVVTKGSVTTGLAPASITNLTGTASVANGSLISSPLFTATAGQQLSFYYNFLSADGIGFDFGWVRLVNAAGGEAGMLVTARKKSGGPTASGLNMPPGLATLNPAGAPLNPAIGWALLSCTGCGTGWVTATYTVPAAGSYRLEFGIVNWFDNILDAALAFDGPALDGRPLFSAKTLSDNLACATQGIAAMGPAQVTGAPQQATLLNLLGLVPGYLQAYPSLSAQILDSVIARTDGCALRSAPDGLGLGANGVDFVTSCPAQATVYRCLTDAKGQLSQRP